MSYNISSDKFNDPLLKPILQELTEFFKEYDISFFVIGATARDIVMKLHDETSGRLTRDLDIAITINDWEQYKIIEEGMTRLPNFSKDPNQKQRFKYLDEFDLDIVPFGNIMKDNDKIFWPPDEEFAMSVLGFPAAQEASLNVSIDDDIKIQIASLAGIFILKVAAWKDRNLKTNKDADDMGFILQNYLDIHLNEAVDHFDAVYHKDHTIITGGGAMLGIHLNHILNEYPSAKQSIVEVLINEKEKKVESRLISQMLETHKTLKHEEVRKSIDNILIQLNKELPAMEVDIKDKNEIVLEDNQLVCILSGKVKKITAQEKNLQSVIRMLNEEYGFELSDMERNFQIAYVDPDTQKNKKQKIELVIFETGSNHIQENIIRVCIVLDDKIKVTDKKKGLAPTLENAMAVIVKCEFGLWANGSSYHYLQKEDDDLGYDYMFTDLSDFPGEGETLEDIDRADRSKSRKPANDSLIKVFKRSHDYIYGNEGRKKDAFWQLLNLIFCKLYDEKRRFISMEQGESYRRKFWVGVKEQNSDVGLKAVSKRIKGLFEELKTDEIFSEVFSGNEVIDLTDKGLAFIAGELAKYSFLDASVDVKGMAYETIVSNTLKQEAGQFFTPRNIVKTMVEMMNPTENTRVLDPACGSGGFLVMVLDHVRKQIGKELFPELDGPLLEEKYNSLEVNNRVKDYAEKSIFGFDFDPDLKKAARMNMVMAGDGHANIFHVNSLAYPNWAHTEEMDKINTSISHSLNSLKDLENHYGTDARGKFDMIFTNPPFGAKVKVDKTIIYNDDGTLHYKLGKYSDAPEVLFIEACYNFLKPGGKMAIVLPDGILGNPNTLPVREWILDKFKILASVDLAVEAFLPQVGVQASLLFLQKKSEIERQLVQDSDEDYDVFMAIAEKLGKDRRGNPIYLRDEDGAELLFETETRYLIKKKNGLTQVKTRKEKLKQLDDDLPKITKAYNKFLKGDL